MSNGTSAVARRSSFRRSSAIAELEPKITSSGGRLPNADAAGAKEDAILVSRLKKNYLGCVLVLHFVRHDFATWLFMKNGADGKRFYSAQLYVSQALSIRI